MTTLVRLVTTGSTRTVLLVHRWAIKFPGAWAHHPRHWWKSLLLGLLGNMQEVAFSKLGWPVLCPVVFSLPGGALVVMPRLEIITAEQFECAPLHALLNPEFGVPVELKRDSFGLLDGQIVAIDYGS